jgi:hypothetical protein
VADKKCLCLIPDENGNCTNCGRPVDLPNAEAPDLGNIVGICNLIDATAKAYARLLVANTDPGNPALPRLRLIGGVMMRIPHQMLCKEILGPSYKEARRLGYKGSLERWGEHVRDAVATEYPQFSRI